VENKCFHRHTGEGDRKRDDGLHGSGPRRVSKASPTSFISSTRCRSKKLTHAQGGKFKLLLVLPKEYPFKPPTINFVTRIWHPNVTFDEKGSMCIGILKSEAWKPSSKILNILLATQSLLVEPNPDDALEASAAEMFKNNRKGFEKEAKKYVEKYASGK
jgi:ubiquitin-protein ligase